MSVPWKAGPFWDKEKPGCCKLAALPDAAGGITSPELLPHWIGLLGRQLRMVQVKGPWLQ